VKALERANLRSDDLEARIESVMAEHRTYVEKVDRELGNQRSLRDEDQAIFNRVAESRD
jgi:hypothetical protein